MRVLLEEDRSVDSTFDDLFCGEEVTTALIMIPNTLALRVFVRR